MAITFVKRSELPVAMKGKVGTMSVGITGNGQIVLSALSNKALDGAKKIVAAFDGAVAYIFPETAKAVAKVGDADKISLSFSKKGGTASFSGAAILRNMQKYGASLTYDFKASGNQTLPVTVNEKFGCLTFTFPGEKLNPRPVVKRVKKNKLATATIANPGEVVGTPVPELELELA